jgi:hypothetical protein
MFKENSINILNLHVTRTGILDQLCQGWGCILVNRLLAYHMKALDSVPSNVIIITIIIIIIEVVINNHNKI